jgi:hypothetical protein
VLLNAAADKLGHIRDQRIVARSYKLILDVQEMFVAIVLALQVTLFKPFAGKAPQVAHLGKQILACFGRRLAAKRAEYRRHSFLFRCLVIREPFHPGVAGFLLRDPACCKRKSAGIESISDVFVSGCSEPPFSPALLLAKGDSWDDRAECD